MNANKQHTLKDIMLIFSEICHIRIAFAFSISLFLVLLPWNVFLGVVASLILRIQLLLSVIILYFVELGKIRLCDGDSCVLYACGRAGFTGKPQMHGCW